MNKAERIPDAQKENGNEGERDKLQDHANRNCLLPHRERIVRLLLSTGRWLCCRSRKRILTERLPQKWTSEQENSDESGDSANEWQSRRNFDAGVDSQRLRCPSLRLSNH